MEENRGFEQVLQVLPLWLRREIGVLPEEKKRCVEELRFRIGRPASVLYPAGECIVGRTILTRAHLEHILELASGASLHAVIDQIRQGFLTIPGGHRMGICGRAVMEDGKIRMIDQISSLSVRIAKEHPGIADALFPQLMQEGRMQSTLIIAPPGAGKTSLLREIIRCLADGKANLHYRIGVVDQRGELSGAVDGRAQFELGWQTDVLLGSPKGEGLMMLLRCMNPQILAVDEITAPEDMEALSEAGGCGTGLLATVHGYGLEDLRGRKFGRKLLECQLFSRVILIEKKNGTRSYRVEAAECGNCWGV